MGNKCELCLTTTKQAWPNISWEGVLLKMRTDDQFAKEVSQAIKVKSGHATQAFPKEDVKVANNIMYMVEKEYNLISEQEFETRFGMKIADAGLVAEEYVDEYGNSMKGIVMDDGSAQRKIKIVSVQNLCLEEWLHAHDKQLRPSQGKDVKNWFLQDMRSCKGTPKVLKPKEKAPVMTFDRCSQLVKEKKEQKAAELREQATLLELQKAAGEAPPPPAVTQSLLPNTGGVEVEEFEGVAVQEDVFMLPSQKEQMAKTRKCGKLGQVANNKASGVLGRKLKEKDRTKITKGQKRKAADSLPSSSVGVAVLAGRTEMAPPALPHSHSGESDGRSDDGRSVAGSVATAATAQTENEKTFNKHVEELNISRILAGEALGDRAYNCRRSIAKMKREGVCSEVVALQAHHDIAVIAQDSCSKWKGSRRAPSCRPDSRKQRMWGCVFFSTPKSRL